MYNLECVDASQIDTEEDIVVSGLTFSIVVDIFSVNYLKGTTIDYVSSLKETGFRFENQSAKKTCGCGSSFSV
jgi:iron-sulfur cluster assembly accessory protein